MRGEKIPRLDTFSSLWSRDHFEINFEVYSTRNMVNHNRLSFNYIKGILSEILSILLNCEPLVWFL